MTDAPIATIGLGPLRPAPDGMPDPNLQPPTIAESRRSVRGGAGDRPRGTDRARPSRSGSQDLADRLDATYLDWLFPVRVVTDVVIQLQADWMADYRNSSGIAIDDGPTGPTVTIEDSSRVDPWIVRQAQRTAASCTERLAEFSRRDHPSSGA